MRNMLVLLFLLMGVGVGAQEKLYPAVKGFGVVYQVPFATERPDPSLTYKILVDVSTNNDKPDILNENLENAAKLMNLHRLAKVPAKNCKVDIVIHGAAGVNVMNNESYRKKFGVDNPNLPLLTALDKAGATILVCGQTLIKRNIDHLQIAPEVHIAESAVTTITSHVLKGYTVMKY